MGDDVDAALAKLVKDSTQFVASPETMDQLIARGITPDVLPAKTKEEYIDELFTLRKEGALVIVEQFPAPPNIPIPTINSLYAEI